MYEQSASGYLTAADSKQGYPSDALPLLPLRSAGLVTHLGPPVADYLDGFVTDQWA